MANFHGGDRPARVRPIGYWQPTIPSIPMITQSSGNCQHKIFTMYSGRTGTLRYSPYPLSHILDRLAQAFATDNIFRSRTA
ncbi:MAG: hypothetical protein GDA43_10790 [Hormoscilla sp. SP5CHS1]|nr:hypothetical protein [Hormoscilla sp. SP12CHS1]MBC6453635.1 hypothetical protein [Hormoscilla sp. SP5CHS1]